MTTPNPDRDSHMPSGKTAAVMGVEDAIDTSVVPPLPDPVTRIWDRLQIRDQSMILCLEAIVRSVRINGTAMVSDVVGYVVEAHLRAARLGDGSGRTEHTGDDRHPDQIRAELIDTVLPRLARVELIGMPHADLNAPDATIEIANPWLRLALVESGLIELENSTSSALTIGRPTAIRAHPPHLPDARQQNHWSQLWFSIQRFSWTTLAVVPASPTDTGLASASALVSAGRLYHQGAVHLIDATGAAPASVDLIIASMSGSRPQNSQLVIALDSPLANPASIPLARHAGVALLSVSLGSPTLEESRRTIDSIGRRFFVGSVAIRPSI